MLAALRKLRHGPLRSLNPVWIWLGRIWRAAVSRFGKNALVRQQIGPYGPFRLSAHFAFSNLESWGGGHNNGFVALVEQARNAHCVLDIGAHVGLVALPVRQALLTDGRLIAFEPSEANLRYLTMHLAGNGMQDVTVESALVGSETGEVSFFEQKVPAGQNARAIKKNPELYSEVRRQQISLDDYCTQHGIKPDLIKIDVEGAEMDVLLGARNMLMRDRPTIFLSVHPTELTLLGRSVQELTALISELGYRCSEIDGAAVTQFRLAEYLLTPKDNSNDVA